MHPILADAKQLGLYLLGCLPIGIVLIIGLGRQGAWVTAAVFFLPLMMVYAFIGLSSYYLCQAFPIAKEDRSWRAVPAHVSAAATVGGLCVALAWAWARLLESLNIGLQPQLYLAQPWLLFVVGALLFWWHSTYYEDTDDAQVDGRLIQISARVARNLAILDGLLARQKMVTRLAAEAGWYATLRIPALEGDDQTALRLLTSARTAVYPGYFFGFPGGGWLVVSLLPQEEEFAGGAAAVLKHFS